MRNVATLNTIYFALIHSQTAYGIIKYGATTNKLDNILLLKKAIRIIVGLKTRDSVRDYCLYFLNSIGY